MISSLVMVTIFVALGLPVAVVCIAWRLLTGNIMPLYRGAMWVVRTGLWLGGIRIDIVGLDRVPKGRACIFMSNHVSNLDPPILLPLIPGRTSVFLKKSLMKIPVLGYGMRLAEFVPVTRAGNVDEARESTEKAVAVLRKGIHIMTFVEGTRSPDGRLLPFKKGPFYLAMEAGAPCIPVTITGTAGMMCKGSLRVKPGTACVEFHWPVEPGMAGGREELLSRVHDAIASGLPKEMR